MTTVDEAGDRAVHAAAVKAVRQNIGTATIDLGRAAAKLTADPEAALAAFDRAAGLMKDSRDVFAAAAGLEAAHESVRGEDITAGAGPDDTCGCGEPITMYDGVWLHIFNPELRGTDDHDAHPGSE